MVPKKADLMIHALDHRIAQRDLRLTASLTKRARQRNDILDEQCHIREALCDGHCRLEDPACVLRKDDLCR